MRLTTVISAVISLSATSAMACSLNTASLPQDSEQKAAEAQILMSTPTQTAQAQIQQKADGETPAVVE